MTSERRPLLPACASCLCPRAGVEGAGREGRLATASTSGMLACLSLLSDANLLVAVAALTVAGVGAAGLLRFQDELPGLLGVVSTEPGAFDEAALALLAAIASE